MDFESDKGNTSGTMSMHFLGYLLLCYRSALGTSMMVGDVIEVKDKEGGQYEAVIREHLYGRAWFIEWVAGPNDGNRDLAMFEDDE